MKTIKIFLAPSEELENDREAFTNLIRRLNDAYEKRGIYLYLYDGDDYNNADNEEIGESRMFLALFHKEAGRIAVEEFDVAKNISRTNPFPKPHVYCKDISEGDSESEELKEFKERLINEMGHYWSRYANEDSMQLHFVLQLQLVETTNQEALKVEDGNIMFDGLQVAKMENLPFAARNEDFQKMHKRLAELPEEIDKRRLRVDKYPDNEEFKDELQKLQNEYNALKDSFAEYQNNLFATAKRITQLQNEQITDRMRRAMDAFNEGKIREANIILEEAERDAEIALQRFKESKELMEQNRNNVIKSIEEILLKVDTTMADLSIDIEERINKVDKLYSQAVEMAKEIEYKGEKYADILAQYAEFSYTYAYYDKALDMALELYLEALDIQKEVLGEEHLKVATYYNNIGSIFHSRSKYEEALHYYFKALKINKKVLGEEHLSNAPIYNNIGNVHEYQKKPEEALYYFLKALRLKNETLGRYHPSTAITYNNIGSTYTYQGKYDTALKVYFKALKIQEKVLGKEHPDTATIYSNIGYSYKFYKSEKEYKDSLSFYIKALKIRINIYGKKHPNTALSYNNIGAVYSKQGEYDKALKLFSKALEIQEKVLGKEHPDTATSYNNISGVYYMQGDYNNAIKYATLELEIMKNNPNANKIDLAERYYGIGYIYYKSNRNKNALNHLHPALTIFEKELGKEDEKTANIHHIIGLAYKNINNLTKAKQHLDKARKIYNKLNIEGSYNINNYQLNLFKGEKGTSNFFD